MSGPWEKYQQPAQDGPWSRYAQQKPDFSNVQGSVGQTVKAQPRKAPTYAMPGLGSVAEAQGGFLDAAQHRLLDVPISIAQARVNAGDFPAFADKFNQWVADREANYQRRVTGTPASDMGGNVGSAASEIALGAVPFSKASMVGRGIKGTGLGARAARVAAPAAANTGLGAGIGAMRTVRDGETRAGNASAGAGSALIGHGIGGLIGTGVRGAQGLIDPLTRRGQERIAALTIKNAAIDPSRLGAVAPSAIHGVERNLAEQSLDPGIAQFVRQFPEELADQGIANNEARVAAVRSAFHGATDDSARAIEGARNTMAEQTLAGLKQIRNPAPIQAEPNFFGSLGGTQAAPAQPPSAISLKPVEKLIGQMIPQYDKRPAVRGTLEYVMSVARGGVRDAEDAYQFRKTIDDLMEGKIGGDLAASKNARKELMQVKDALDAEMSRAFPQWGQYLKSYKADSQKATQARVGEAVLSRARQGANPNTGERMMTGTDLAATVNNIDSVVARTAKFRHANAANTLDQAQRNLLGQLQDDANRMIFAQNAGRSVGSNTAQNLGTQALMANMFGGGPLSKLLGQSQLAQRLLLSPMAKTLNVLGVPERLRAVTAELLANPQMARQALATLNASDRALVQRVLASVGAASGASMPLAAAAGQ